MEKATFPRRNMYNLVKKKPPKISTRIASEEKYCGHFLLYYIKTKGGGRGTNLSLFCALHSTPNTF